MKHIVLMGDSIIDNGAYVHIDEPDISAQLRKMIPRDTLVTKLATDGDAIQDIKRQLNYLPKNTTDIIISVGGNDALSHIDIFEKRIKNISDAILMLSKVQKDFEVEYSSMLDDLQSLNIPIAICTIYYPRFNSKSLDRVVGFVESREHAEMLQKVTVTTLAIFNDVITKLAIGRGIPVIDLRTIFTMDEDYANPIEPSVIGGAKLANVVLNYLYGDELESSVRVYS